MTAKNNRYATPDIPFATDWALFLDVDGTLLELTSHPDDVNVTGEIRSLVDSLKQGLEGALALISGRDLRNLDDLFRNRDLPAAGLHGVEIRPGNGSTDTRVQTVDTVALHLFRERIQAFASTRAGLTVEDKGLGIAVHYRRAPELQADVERILTEVLHEQSHEFELQRGKMLAEIKSRRFDKGFAIREFMSYRRFRDRRPVFIGDDATDEDGFAVVNEMRGISIKVGDGNTRARYHLRGPGDVLDWLGKYERFLTHEKS